MPKVAHDAGVASGRAGRGRRVSTSLAEINVVPLVDVMLVLLIIFMVTAPLIQRGIDVKLPVARRATEVAGERVEITIPDSFRQSQVRLSSARSRCAPRYSRSASGRRWKRAATRRSTCAATPACSIRI